MSCSNCYNGCPEILSDQCVKYTGVDVPVLGIQNGDSLSYVEQAIITFLTSTLDGSGIKVDIDQNIICEIVSNYLPTCGDLTVIDVLKALIQAVCELRLAIDNNSTSINEIDEFIATLEGAYTIGCLSGVTSTSGTHAILQAVITKLCAFISSADVTYVKISDINTYIAAYLATLPSSSKYYTKMVPYVAVPFFPTVAILSNFSVTGVGSGDWEKIYFCNGLNGTPDMRGRVPVGVTTGMGGGALAPAVDFALSPLTPNYQLSTPTGATGVTLTVPQLPSHTHTATATSTGTISPNPHDHTLGYFNKGGGNGSNVFGTESTASGTKTTSSVNLSVSINTTVTNVSTGGNQAHSNVQPGIGAYYIMYIP